MTVDTVVTGVELALDKPGTVAALQGTRVDGLEVAEPRQKLACLSAPEGLGVGDGLLVQLLVVLETCSSSERGAAPVSQ
ncbi:hypothetical protein CH063_15841 [Colletotrichum higginsianum]|uniref:Uncharacterized protein n=1 Tax=Colletotrichum higginsianum (strain IMI 349063) TaxID=759273 RepID=H1W4P8_COLHI|nr:hypothetical protein CH063_15841 [Colletotrichum higginsianum]